MKNKDNNNFIFFSRSYIDYESEYEQEWIKNIKESWKSCYIIPIPKNLEKQQHMMYGDILYEFEKEHFFPLIYEADLIVAAPAWNTKYKKNRGKFSAGVILEIYYAIKQGKRIVGLVNNDMRDINIKDTEEYYNNKNIKIGIDRINEFDYF